MRKLSVLSFIIFLLLPFKAFAAFCAPGFCFPPPPPPPPAPDPIVIVPGIVGSWNWDVLLHDGTGGTWDFTPFTNVYQPLVDALRNAFTNEGLDPNKNVFIAFYDWRQPNVLAANDYLRPVIDKAKQESGKTKVDIIAHSMGGILARSYIQGAHYDNDVNQFFMLGTPNYGSGDVYAPWEGGYIPENLDLVQKFFFATYFLYNKAFTDSQAYQFVHTKLLSIRDLLPTYNYLKEQGTGNMKQTETLQEQNITLNTFNAMVADLPDLVGEVTTIAGGDQSTVGEIPVVSQPVGDDPLWRDGKPDPIDPDRNNSTGDNRVLLSSAHIGCILLMSDIKKRPRNGRSSWSTDGPLAS